MVSLLHGQVRAVVVHSVTQRGQQLLGRARSLHGRYEARAAAGEGQKRAVGVAGGAQAAAQLRTQAPLDGSAPFSHHACLLIHKGLRPPDTPLPSMSAKRSPGAAARSHSRWSDVRHHDAEDSSCLCT